MSDINVIVNDEIVNIDVIDEPVLVNVVNSPGVPGAPGAPGVGVPVGGTTGQVLAKNSATNYDTEWVDVSGGAWGTITGTLSNQTDLQTALNAKFDDPTGTTAQYLRGDGSLATFPAIPSGTVTSVGLTMPSAFSVANSPITSSGTLAVTATGTSAQYIAGDGSLATFPSLTGYVPYTGATANVDLGTHRITAQNATFSSSGSGDTATITHSSGSGIGLNITKGGNGEGLYVNKTGGSGNAATIIGTLNATTLVKSGGLSTEYLKADGSTSTLTNPITGTGTAGQVSYWSGTSTQAGSNNLFWDAVNNRLGIGTNSPTDELNIQKTSASASVGLRAKNLAATGKAFFAAQNEINEYISLEVFGSSWSFGGNNNKATITSSTSKGMAFLVYSDNANAHFSINTRTTLTERFRLFGNTGNVLIQNGGTFTDGGQRLQVQGTTLLNGNVTFSSATGMTWDATNSRLGIGTNAPAYKLHNVGSSGFDNGNSGDAITILNNGFISMASTRFRASSTQFQFQDNAYNIKVLLNTSGSISYFNSGGNYHFGGASDSGERLQVTGTMKVTGNTKIGNTVFTDTASNIIIGVDGTAARGAIANNFTFQDFQFVNTSVASGNINSWAFGQRRDTYFGNTIGSFQIVGAYVDNTGTGSMVGGGFRVPLICNPNGDVLINGGSANVVNRYIGLGVNTPTALTDIGASTTTRASLRIRSGTAPTSPNDGDIWFDGTDIKMRIGGVTKTFTLL